VFANRRTVVLEPTTASHVDQQQTLVNSSAINDNYETAIAFAYYALGSVFMSYTGGSINPMLSGNSNFVFAIYDKSLFHLYTGIGYWVMGIFSAVVSGIVLRGVTHFLLVETPKKKRRSKKKKKKTVSAEA